MDKHDGNLGHNASVTFVDDVYVSDEDGHDFMVESVSISDKTRCVVLVPSEALSLLAWLEQERTKLELLSKEFEG